ncbi:MAG: tRNA lysidine(34) synthetase TilS [Gammaproteobacteria bacterium]|nr:MAG: tRNA lysidine(34) synthetase TilS [Gammaproteobacteria bacterium]
MIDPKSLIIPHLQENKTCYVAYSGGVDSTVLLYEVGEAAKDIKCNVVAIHINHEYSKYSGQWEKHCKSFCKDYGLILKKFSFKSNNLKGASLESLMREKRYNIFEKVLSKDEILFMGHHLDDQIETLFFRMLRGSGLKGSSSIPAKRALGKGILIRPFLKLSKNDLIEIAKRKKLSYVEDESNNNIEFDRNYLRNEVISKISKRWPNYRKSLSKYIDNNKASYDFLSKTSSQELKNILVEEKINVEKLKKYDSEYQKILILNWLESKKFRLPSSQVLEELTKSFLNTKKTSQPKFIWGSKEKGNYVCLRIKKGFMSAESNL